MNIHVVFAHPSHNSFSFRILQKFKDCCLRNGHELSVSDLYAKNFRTELSLEEYQRESSKNCSLPVPMDVQEEQEYVSNANMVCFIYPNWWSDCPAILKGWFDRVFTAGFAFQVRERAKMGIVDFGLILCPSGHSRKILEENGTYNSMRNVMLDDRLADRFSHKKMLILDNTLSGDDIEQSHLVFLDSVFSDLENYMLS